MRSTVTVLEPARTHDMTTLETAKSDLGVAAKDRTKNELLLRLIFEASDACRRWCRRPFAEEKVSEVFEVDACEPAVRWLVLSRKPVKTIHSIAEGTNDPLVDGAGFSVDKEHGMISRGAAGFPTAWTNSKTTVVYTAGYALLGELPPSYERACLRLISGYYHGRGRDPSVRSVDIPDVESVTYASESFGQAMPEDVKALLNPFRRVI